MKNIVFAWLLISSTAMAQKSRLLSGTLNELKGQTPYAIEFTYDSMLVGSDIAEKVYLQEKKNQWNAKQPGKGDEFVKLWFDSRTANYQPLFIRNFERSAGVKAGDPAAKYTLIVKTKHTEGGWDGGVMGLPSDISGEVWIVESADKTKVIAKISFDKYRNKKAVSGDFAMTTRIQAAYGFAGNGVGALFKKKMG